MFAACGGGSATATPASSPSAAGDATEPAAATATPDAIGNPAVDGQLVYDHVKKLAVDIGPRVAGTPSEIAARDFISATLSTYGYDVTLQDFGFDASAYLPARIDYDATADPSNVTSVPAIALLGSDAGTAHGALVAAGIGRPEDFPPGGLAGAVALIERGDLTFTQKAQNAIAAGASAIVVYNDVAGTSVFDLDGQVAVPVVSISLAAGTQLAATPGPLDVTVTVSPPNGTAYNVIAKPKGVTSCDTITGGHYDSVSVTGGADDNASGAASVIEVARVIAAKKLPAHDCFVLFSAEEFGLFGSKAYVDKLSPAEIQGLRGMVNLDVVGNSNALELIGDDDLVDVARLQAQKLGVDATPASLPPNTGSDHLSFQRAGGHTVMLYREDNLIHTPQDSIERIQQASLAETVTVALATLQALNP
jgi:aminopeptidase YwaD